LRVLRNLGLLSRVARHYGVPPIQIGRRALYLYRHHNFGFQDAMRCGLLDPNLPDAAAFGCIRRADITPIQNRHNRVEWKCLTEDKAVFYSFCGHAGIPAPEMLAVVGKAGGRTVKGASPSSRAEWERYFANDLQRSLSSSRHSARTAKASASTAETPPISQPRALRPSHQIY
jgi:hypothetical protein